MNTIRLRLYIGLTLAVVCSSSSLRAAVVKPVSLAPALGMMQSVPAFRASVLSQISIVSSLSAQAFPTLSPLVAERPTASDPWRAEAVRFVGALAAQPGAVALHQKELRAALGEQGTELLRKASVSLQAQAAERPELLAQLKNLRSGLDLTDAGAVQELGMRLDSLFENLKSRQGDAPGGTVSASDPAQKAMQASWKLQSSKSLATDWRAKIRSRRQYQGFDVKVQFEEGLAPENLNVGLIGTYGGTPGHVTAIFHNPSLKRAAEVSQFLAKHPLVKEVFVARSVAWRVDEVRRLPQSPDTRFEDPKLVGPAVAKIRELFSGVKMRGDGEYESKQGRREWLASVQVSLVGKPQADRVTLDIRRRFRGSSLDSLSVTLIAGDRPAILVQSKPGAGIFPRSGSTVEWARLSVDKTSVILSLETADGSVASYEIKLQPDGSVKFNESAYTGTIRTTLSKRVL